MVSSNATWPVGTPKIRELCCWHLPVYYQRYLIIGLIALTLCWGCTCQSITFLLGFQLSVTNENYELIIGFQSINCDRIDSQNWLIDVYIDDVFLCKDDKFFREIAKGIVLAIEIGIFSTSSICYHPKSLHVLQKLHTPFYYYQLIRWSL